MTSIHRETRIEVAPERAWDALKDLGALHLRLARGFVVDTQLEAEARLVSFANGLQLREVIVDVDDDRRRVVWTAESEALTHHNGAAQVHADGDATRFVWIADVLPHTAAPRIAAMMDAGIDAIRRTLEADAGARADGSANAVPARS